jgi:UDP:flavonoid glycosyltransferase YjiC (YdhE family)
MSVPRRRKILFVGEGVALTHVTRPCLLAKALDPARYEAILAIPDAYNKLLDVRGIRLESLKSIPSGQFLGALSKGTPLYDYATLSRYVEDDQELLRRVRPDLVVGDFRLSLAVSAPLVNVPYAALANAYWSPYAVMRNLPVPEHIATRFFGVKPSQFFFDRMRPLILAAHVRPHNRLRKHYGMPPLGDLRETYTHGDYTLYLDTPGLVPTQNLPGSHHYLGPAIWSPDIQLPDWWDQVNRDRPTVYLTMGSSGKIKALPILLKALSALQINVLAATAGRADPALLKEYPNCYAADYLPGTESAARSDLVISNGGSSTCYQALS